MSKKLDHILVIDIEATCWDGPTPAGEVSDVIEIGVCPVAVGTLTRLEKRGILIRPERSTVSPFCTQLTTLTQAQVDAGVTSSWKRSSVVRTACGRVSATTTASRFSGSATRPA
jgi:inhibitor of KinA sporulation pathway (predicted exonuclease)